MSLLEKYMTRLSLRRSIDDDGFINTDILLSLEERHLPRVQELIRIMHLLITDLALDYDPEDAEAGDLLMAKLKKLIKKIEDLAKDGLNDLYIESIYEDGEID